MWATWCPPCVRMIPHLSELSRKYTNVKFIGVSNEPVSRIEPFIKKIDMCYNVLSGDLAEYSDEYSVQGIPHAFVIVDKKVVFSGHPADDGFERALIKANAPKKLDFANMTREAIAELAVSVLKEQAKLQGVNTTGCLEKSDFVDAIVTATHK